MALTTAAGAALAGLGAVVLATEAPAATGGDSGALYASAASVVVAMIGGVVAIVTSKSKPAAVEPPPARYIDPLSTHSLPQELSGLLAEALEGERKARDAQERAVRRAELWESRARAAGWTEAKR